MADTCQVHRIDPERVARARQALLSADEARRVADLFKTLAHPTRLGILRALAAETLCVCDLAELLGLSVSAVSHQLRDLRRLDLVRARPEGKLVYYAIRDPFVVDLLERGVRHLRPAEAP